jgi:hypothetical protein
MTSVAISKNLTINNEVKDWMGNTLVPLEVKDLSIYPTIFWATMDAIGSS